MQKYSVFSLIKNAFSDHMNWDVAWKDPTPKKEYDVIIIGGGGHGLATAYYLAKEHNITNVAIVEKGSSIATGTEILNDDGTSTGTYKRSYGELEWKSPHASFDNAIEIEFTHVPQYNINLKAATNPNSSAQTEGSAVFGVFGWTVYEGYLTFILTGNTTNNIDFSASGYNEELGTAGTDYILIQGSSTWNGVHKIKARGTQGFIQTETKVYGSSIGYSVQTALDWSSSAKTIDDDNATPGIASLFKDNLDGDTAFVKALSGTISTNNDRLHKVTYDGAYTLTVTAQMNIGDSAIGAWGSGFTYEEDTSVAIADQVNAGATLNKVIEDNCILFGKNTFSRMEDETFELDLPDYLSRALIHYVKAQFLEDLGQIELSEYFMTKFRKKVEEYMSTRHAGPKQASGFWHMR